MELSKESLRHGSVKRVDENCQVSDGIADSYPALIQMIDSDIVVDTRKYLDEWWTLGSKFVRL